MLQGPKRNVLAIGKSNRFWTQWVGYFPGATNLVIETLADAKHFTMVKDDAARELAGFTMRAMTY